MLIWIVVILVLAAITFFWIKLEHQARLVKFAVLTVILILLALSMFVLFNSGEVDLKSPQGIVSAVYLYIGWLGDFAFDMWDLGFQTTGKVVDALNISESDYAKTSTKIKKWNS